MRRVILHQRHLLYGHHVLHLLLNLIEGTSELLINFCVYEAQFIYLDGICGALSSVLCLLLLSGDLPTHPAQVD